MSTSAIVATLREQARAFAGRSYAPFSEEPVGAVFLADDGIMIPGVRVESASFSLSLPALLNAFTTAVSAGYLHRLVGVAVNRPLTDGDAHYLDSLPGLSLEPVANDTWLHVSERPEPTSVLDPRMWTDGAISDLDHGQGIQLARDAALAAYVPSSDFRVGAVIETEAGNLFPGANVEHPDWSRILCAERNAAGTARTYGEPSARRIFLSCLDDAEGTPCGACRQVLAELTPDAALWMDRHSSQPEKSAPATLLPGFFRGTKLLQGDDPSSVEQATSD
ncbi:cytidine deaminase [Longibacter salinarum]|uniref:Cytidine deaminase n=1 Tax=Longibacter salinarum TaxID=1850348 RepID=A0A2A8D2A2_9BACT|nr:cytidine deaminase [Longibacter salinarum]PEN14943.1 cytidine deaminase [Longibacter salinarum]